MDNVATLIDDAEAELVRVIQATDVDTIALRQPIKSGHKVALGNIRQGGPIVKYGIPIGYATGEIPRGTWVHLHNCASHYDERSAGLDVETGAPRDTLYT